MGTSQSEIYNDDLFTHFKRENWSRILDLGLYELWEDTQNGELCEAYKLDYIPQDDELQHYRFRHYNQNSDNFVQIRYVDVEKKQSLCYHGESYVLTEFIPVKLSDMYDLTFPQTCLILKSAFRAFHTMEAFHGPFIPTEELIGINLKGRPKIWLNKDHSKNKAEKEIKAEIWQKHLGEVSQNVKRVIEIVEQKLKNKNFQKEFRDYFFDNVMNFSQASQYVQQFCEKYHIQMPHKIEYLRFIDDQEMKTIVNEYLSKNKIGVMLEDEANMVDGSLQEGKEKKLVREESAVKPFSRIGSEQNFIQHRQVHYLPAQTIHYKPHSSQVVPIQRVFSPKNATQRPVPFQITVPSANFVPVHRVQQRKLSNNVVFVRPQGKTQKTITIVSTNGVPHIRKVISNNVQSTPMHIGNHVSFIPPSKIAEFQQPIRTQFSDVKQVHLPIESIILPTNQQQQHQSHEELSHENNLVVEKQIQQRQQVHEQSTLFQNGYINDESQIELQHEHENDNYTSEPDWEGIRRQEQWRQQQQKQLLAEQDHHHDFQIRDEQVEHYEEQNDNVSEKYDNAEISLIKQSQKKNISQFEGHYAMFQNYVMENKIIQQKYEEEQPKNVMLSSLQDRNSKLIESKNVVSDEEPEEIHNKIQQSTQDHNQQQSYNILRRFSQKNTSINRGTKQESSGTMVIHESKENIYQGVFEEKFDKIVIANIQQDATENYCQSREGQEHEGHHEDFPHNVIQNVHEPSQHAQSPRIYDDQQWKKLHELQSQKQISHKDQMQRCQIIKQEETQQMGEQYKDYAQQQLEQFEQQQREYVQQQRMKQKLQSLSSRQQRYYQEANGYQEQYRLQQEDQIQENRQREGDYQQLQGLNVGQEVPQGGQIRSQEEKQSTRRFNQYDNLHFRNESEELYQYTPVDSLHKKESHSYSYQPVPRPHYNSGVQEITQIETHQDIENYIRNKYANLIQPAIVVTQRPESQTQKTLDVRKRSTKDYNRAMTFAKPSQQDQEEPQVNTYQYDDYEQKKGLPQDSQKNQSSQTKFIAKYGDLNKKNQFQVEQLSPNGDDLDVGNLQKSLDSKFNKQNQQNVKSDQIQLSKPAHNIHGSQGSQEDGMNIAALDQRLQKFQERQSMQREKSQRKLQSSYAQDLSPRNQNELNFNDLDNIVELMDKKIQESQNKQRESYHQSKDYNVSGNGILEEKRHLFGDIRLQTSINQVSNDFSLKNTTILDKESPSILSNSKTNSKNDYFQNYGLGLQDFVKGEYKTYEYQSISRNDDYNTNNISSQNFESENKSRLQSGINTGSKVLNEQRQGRGVSRKTSYRSTKNNEDARKIADKISDKYEKYMNESSASGKPFAKKSYYDSGASFESSKNKTVAYADYSSKYNAKDSKSYPSNNDFNGKISSYLNPIQELNGENNPSSSYRQKVISKSIRSQFNNPIQNNLQNISKFSGSSSMIGSKKNIAGENFGKGSKVSYNELRDLLWK